jgi:putative membrane protein
VIAFRLAANELRRLSTGRLPRLAILAVLLVPLLYGGLYLYANWDPYRNLDRVPAALVVADRGAGTGGQRLDAGRDVATDLLKAKAFDWHRVDAARAEAGVRDGRYTFAVTLPADFSAALASPSDFRARQGLIVLTTNDANNYTGSTIARRVVDEVRRAVAAKAGTRAANRLLVGFATIQEKAQQAANGAVTVADGAARADDGSAELASGARRLADGQRRLLDGSRALTRGTARAESGARQLDGGARQLAGGLDTLRRETVALPAQSRQLAAGARRVADGPAKLAGTAGSVAATVQQLVDQLDGHRDAIAQRLRELGISEPQIAQLLASLDGLRQPIGTANGKLQQANGDVQRLADGSRQVADGAGRLAAAAPRLTTGIGTAAGGADRLAGGTGRLASGAATLHGGARRLETGLGTAATGGTELARGASALHDGNAALADGTRPLADGLGAAAGQIPNPDGEARARTAKVIGDPVAVRTVGQADAGSYGAGLAPFFLGLALWVGAFVLFMLVRPLSRRALAAGLPARRVALAGWLPAAGLGALQVVLLFVFATAAIGVDPARPVATVAFLLLTSLAFIAVVHGLNAYFGPAGRFVALILLVLQLTTAGGTFPWQTTPTSLHPLHALLPLSYVVDGLRHLLYGGSLSGLGTDVAVLLAYLGVGLALATLAGHRQRVWSGRRLQPELVL